MARLFHEEEVFFHFKIEDGESFDRLVNNLDYTYSAEQLKDYLLEIQPKLAGRCSVSMNGIELNIEDYIPSKKPYQYRKKDAALFWGIIGALGILIPIIMPRPVHKSEACRPER